MQQDEGRRLKEKGRMLDHVVEVAGYNRAYASHRLCLYGKRLFLRGFTRPVKGFSGEFPWDEQSLAMQGLSYFRRVV